MEETGLLKLLKISNEDILLSKNYKSLPKNYAGEANKLLQIYIDREEYEKCAIVRDYLLSLNN